MTNKYLEKVASMLSDEEADELAHGAAGTRNAFRAASYLKGRGYNVSSSDVLSASFRGMDHKGHFKEQAKGLAKGALSGAAGGAFGGALGSKLRGSGFKPGLRMAIPGAIVGGLVGQFAGGLKHADKHWKKDVPAQLKADLLSGKYKRISND